MFCLLQFYKSLTSYITKKNKQIDGPYKRNSLYINVDVVTLEEYREKNQSNSLCTNLNKSQTLLT